MTENIDITDFFEPSDITEMQASQLKPLVLAYIGDCVYELFVRSFLVRGAYRDVNELHRKAVNLVKANAQARILHIIEPELNEREADIVRRGRNAHCNTVPKNADVGEYHAATGFEALVGYLHITGQKERLLNILNQAVHIYEK